MKTEIMEILENLYNGRQSVVFEGICKITKEKINKKIRILIKKDSYDFQSYAKIQYWDGSEWKHVTSLDWNKTKSKELFHNKNVDELTTLERSHITSDKNELIKIAEEIIF